MIYQSDIKVKKARESSANIGRSTLRNAGRTDFKRLKKKHCTISGMPNHTEPLTKEGW